MAVTFNLRPPCSEWRESIRFGLVLDGWPAWAEDLASKIFQNHRSDRPPAGRRQARGQQAAKRRRPEAGRPQKSHFRQLVNGLSHGDAGTPYFFHTFQRRSNRGRATVLDGSTDGDEISVKGKSLVPPISGTPTGAANGSKLQSETSMFRMEKIH